MTQELARTTPNVARAKRFVLWREISNRTANQIERFSARQALTGGADASIGRRRSDLRRELELRGALHGGRRHFGGRDLGDLGQRHVEPGPLLHPHGSGDRRVQVLNATYLVARERADSLMPLTRTLRDTTGADIELSGPWVPYSFVGEV